MIKWFTVNYSTYSLRGSKFKKKSEHSLDQIKSNMLCKELD